MSETKSPEPWLRGTLTDVPAVLRAVLHALELAREDVARWCSSLSDSRFNESYCGLPPVAFHIRHIPGSLDRLLTYAEGRQLTDEQLCYLKSESAPVAASFALAEFDSALANAAKRVLAFVGSNLEEPRSVGRKQLPTNVGGLLVHVADHTQRHVGQVVTTAKLLHARPDKPSA